MNQAIRKKINRIFAVATSYVAILALSTGFVYAEDGSDIASKAPGNFYITANSGVSTGFPGRGINFSPEYVGGGGVGYYFHDMLRSDVTVQYRNISASKGSAALDFKKANNTSYMWNMYLNLSERTDRFVPYLFAGLGYGATNVYTMVDNTVTKNSKKSSGFTWNTGVGGIFKITERIGLDIFYRYVDIGRVKGSETISGIPFTHTKYLQAHEASLGIIIAL